MSGERNDRDRLGPSVRFQTAGRFESVHARHHQVHQDDRRMNTERDTDGIETVRRRVNEKPTRRQELRQHLAGVWLVVDNKH